jgi:orotidine-5'-phosphate decarboxylase
MHFADRLMTAVQQKKNFVCVGLDPQMEHIPAFLQEGVSPAEAIFSFNKGIIDAVCDLVPVVKLQSAFYEMHGHEGVRVFQETLKYAKSKGLMTVADAKRNDVSHSAEAYAKAFLSPEGYDADSLTITPYLGWDGIKPFMDMARKHGKGLFVLVKTSNPSAGDFQDLETSKEHIKLFEIMGQYVESWGSDDLGSCGYSFLGAVVGATHPADAKRLRGLMPSTIFLVPGYGAQGGTSEGVKNCLNDDGFGALINSSRGITAAWQKAGGDGEDYAQIARNATLAMIADLNS